MNIMDLPKVKGIYRFDSIIAHLTWFKVGGVADILFKPKNIEDLVFFLKNKPVNIAVTVIGAGSNTIIRDAGIEGVLIRLGSKFSAIHETDNGDLAVGAGCLNYNLAKYAKQQSISGFEFLVGIPGTIGGGVAMNAGSYGCEFKDIITSVEAVDLEGNVKSFSCEDMGFIYRNNSLPGKWVFTKVVFKKQIGTEQEISKKMQKISQEREKTQPITEKTGGSTFANPVGHKAWKLIDEAGLRGHKIGGAIMSKKHCNFMINDGTATAEDMEKLGEFVKKRVQENSGIILEWEIKRMGKNARI